MSSSSTSNPEPDNPPDEGSQPQEDSSSGAFNDGCEDLSNSKEFNAFWEYLMESKNSDFRLKLSSKQKNASGPWFHRHTSRDEDF